MTDRPTAAEVAELRAAVLYSYQAGEPDLDSITSKWVRGIVSQPDGGLVDVIDTLAAVLEAPQRPPLGPAAAVSDVDPCEVCGHPWVEHDGMGDCHHLDARTLTGLCRCSDRRVQP